MNSAYSFDVLCSLDILCLRTHQTVFDKENSYHFVYTQACEKLLTRVGFLQ